MKKIALILVFGIIAYSCHRINNEPSKNEYVAFDKSFSTSIKNKLDQQKKEFEFNRLKWFESYKKSLYINAICDSLIDQILTIPVVEVDLKSICGRFLGSYYYLDISDKELDLIIHDRFESRVNNKIKIMDKYGLITDLRLSTLDIINSIYIRTTANDYSVNAMHPVIMDSGKTVKRGEMYTAKIGLLGYDSTLVPTVYLDDYYLEVMSGCGIFNATFSTPGKKTFSGKITYPRENHVIDTFYYNGSFYVE